MPPRHVYWTIIVDGKPTAFRAHMREELLPTLRQLQSKHPDAVLKWFARGKLWESPEEEREAGRRQGREPRGRDWRPGGEHKDPRERFKVPRDEKRRRFADRQRRDRTERGGEGAVNRPPDRDRPRPPWNPEGRHERGGWQPRERRERPAGDRPSSNPEGRPREERRVREWSPGGPARPPGGRREWNPEGRGPREDSQRREWKREERPRGPKPPRREWNPESRPRGPREEFRDRKPGGQGHPGGGRPFGGGGSSGRPPDRRPGGGRPPGADRSRGGRPPGGDRPRGPGGWRKPGGGGGNRGRGGGSRGGGGNRGGGR